MLESPNKLGLRRCPKCALAMFLVIFPKTIVSFARILYHRAHTMPQSLAPVSIVIISIHVKTCTQPVALVIIPLTTILIESSSVSSLRQKPALARPNYADLVLTKF